MDFEDFTRHGFCDRGLVTNICHSRLVTSPPQDRVGKQIDGLSRNIIECLGNLLLFFGLWDNRRWTLSP